jgi:hypothetical protein
MFEKFGDAAERLATNVGESRRGFLARIGQAALGVAGVVGGVLAMPAPAHAARSGYCTDTKVFQGYWYNGFCACGRQGQRNSACTGPAPYPHGNGCGLLVGWKTCTCM